MSHDEPDADLEDYLDGRMTEGRRRAFEARVANDEGLAGRIRAHRAAAEALRAEPEALSPDFYSRLRARFEEPRAAAPRWFRLASWETAGLATAVVIALVLFVPLFVGQPPAVRSPVAPDSRQAARPDSEVAPLADRPRENRAETGQESDTPPEDFIERKKEAGEGRAPVHEDARKDSAVEGDFAPSPPLPLPAPRQELEKRQASSDESAPAAPAPSSRGEAGLGEQAGVGVAGPPAEKVVPERLQARSTLHPSSAGTAVPAGLVEPGAQIEVDDPAEWSAVAREVRNLALGEYDPARRVVLVGDRDGGMSCSASRVVELADGYEIRLAGPAPGARRDGDGCAFVLPHDGKPVRVVGPVPSR